MKKKTQSLFFECIYDVFSGKPFKCCQRQHFFHVQFQNTLLHIFLNNFMKDDFEKHKYVDI
jgi:hypothetical protein